MSLKAILNDRPVWAGDVSGTGSFLCAECSDGMYYVRAHRRNDGGSVVAHFAHRPVANGQQRTCTISLQSEEHLNGKETVRLSAPEYFWWLKNAVADVEVPIGQRRADVLFTLHDNQKVIFEIQVTKIPRREIAERTLDYHKMHCHVIWCFPERRRDDLYLFGLRHFYCVGLISDNGMSIEFRGNISPFRYTPSLKYPFDDDILPIVIKPTPLPPIQIEKGNWQVFNKEYQKALAAPLPEMEEAPRTAFHTLIRPRNAWSTVPESMRSIVRLYINSDQTKDRERAMELCERYELDYMAMRKPVRYEVAEEIRAKIQEYAITADDDQYRRTA